MVEIDMTWVQVWRNINFVFSLVVVYLLICAVRSPRNSDYEKSLRQLLWSFVVLVLGSVIGSITLVVQGGPFSPAIPVITAGLLAAAYNLMGITGPRPKR